MGIKQFFKNLLREEKTVEGESTKDKTYSSHNDFPDRQTAIREFERTKSKLFNINSWSELPGLSSKFELYNAAGERSEAEKPALNDFIRIMLPGPSPENWVKVTDIQIEDESAEFTVNPSEDPTEKEGQKIEHFFIKEATSTFKVTLRNNTIHASEIGKNEGINNQGQEAGNREMINTLLAEGGWAGFQKIQWEKLTDYLVHRKELKNK